jgi:hypothetical protein
MRNFISYIFTQMFWRIMMEPKRRSALASLIHSRPLDEMLHNKNYVFGWNYSSLVAEQASGMHCHLNMYWQVHRNELSHTGGNFDSIYVALLGWEYPL